MNQRQHTRRHWLLSQALDELVADWISHRGLDPAKPSFFTQDITLKDFVTWASQQADSATPLINTAGHDISGLSHVPYPYHKHRATLVLHTIRNQKGQKTDAVRHAAHKS